jgi:SRSO17 transposase
MQQFISVGAWQDAPVILQHQALVAEALGECTGVVILDGCDFPKQGEDSVGVARQWCGPLGKVANCQTGVVLVYASSKGYTLIDRRLYLPEEWFDDDHRERWNKCGIQKATPFQTKPQLGWAMLEPLIQRGVLPFQWVTMDQGYGRDTVLLNRLNNAARLLCFSVSYPNVIPLTPSRHLDDSLMRLPIVVPAPLVTAHAGVFRDLFENRCRFRHFQNYLTGLMVLSNKSMANIVRCVLNSADKTSRVFSRKPRGPRLKSMIVGYGICSNRPERCVSPRLNRRWCWMIRCASTSAVSSSILTAITIMVTTPILLRTIPSPVIT